MIQEALNSMPMVAILRGVNPDEVEEIADVLYKGGVRCIEVPLNSPTPFESIRRMAESAPDDCLIGAGTVVAKEDVRMVKDAGGKLIVTPNTCATVIKAAIALEMIVVPGVATPTDAFAATAAGATWLKLFPASTYGVGHLKALRAVLPANTRFLAVGGVGAQELADWRAAGVVGFGIGSELYRAGDNAADVGKKLASIRTALQAD